MNWKIEYIVDKQFIKVTSEGDFNAKDHREMIEDVTSREFWKAGMPVFFDNRKVNFNGVNYNVINEAARNHIKNNELIGGGRAAILMKSVADFGIGRQFQLLTNGVVSAELHIFQDEKKALGWLLGAQKNNAGH